MKRIAFFIMVLGAICAASATECSSDSVYRYNILYKWGFIEKVAGKGTVTIKNHGDTITGVLNGSSIPWGGRIFSVSDTLKSVITKADGQISQKVLYENGWYRKPLVADSAKIDSTSPADYRTIHGEGELSADAATMEAVTLMADMLAYFRIAQLLDFEKYEPQQTLVLPIDQEGCSDKRVRLTFLGPSVFQESSAWEVIVNYTYNGTYSTYPITTYIDRTTLAPLSIAAELLIGHVEMILE